MGAPFTPTGRRPLQLAPVAECFCGVAEAFPLELGLPAGWRELEGAVQCPDCARAAEPALIPAEGALRGDHGCRLAANAIGGGAVVLRIHAGARPIAGTADKPLHFVARDADLVTMIAELERFRAWLSPASSRAVQAFEHAADTAIAAGGVLELRANGDAVLTVPLERLRAEASLSPTATKDA